MNTNEKYYQTSSFLLLETCLLQVKVHLADDDATIATCQEMDCV